MEVATEVELSTGVKVATEVEMAAEVEALSDRRPSTSNSVTSIWSSDEHYEELMKDWLQTINSLKDSQRNAYDNAINFSKDINLTLFEMSIFRTEDRINNLTLFEMNLLQTEDQLNDLFLKDLVSNDCFDFDWKLESQTFTGRQEILTETPGPTFTISDQTTIVDIFDKMITNDILDQLCEETNRYASQKIASLKAKDPNLSPSRLYRWSPTDRDEMVSFLAITILQGLYPRPEEEAYFTFNGFGTMPYFSRVMSYHRYLLLKNMLHFVDNDSITHSTQLCKIQPIIDYFNEKFSSLYKPSQEVVIDESLLKSPVRPSFSQKLLLKAARGVVKTYDLCESSSGYLWKFFVYAGKSKQPETATTNDKTTDNDDEPNEFDVIDATITDDELFGSGDERLGAASVSIICDLVKPLLNRGHTLIMDYFYNSPLLARWLKKQKTDCYGTLRLNREFVPGPPKTLNKTDLQKCGEIAYYCSDLSIIVWRGAELISTISTYHSVKPEHKPFDRCPDVFRDYYKSIESIHKKDQFLPTWVTKDVGDMAWYKTLFFRLFNTAIFNCFIIYSSSANQKMDHRQFRTALAEELLKRHRNLDLTTEPRLTMTKTGSMITQRPKPAAGNRPQLQQRHFPARSGRRGSRCWLCAKRKRESRTIWKCMECDVNLCIDGCFMEYHI